MNKLEEDIKTGQFSSAYLLYGEDTYLRTYYRNLLIKAMIPRDDTINFSRFYGKDVSLEELGDLAGTMPFFAPYRLIVVEDTGWFTAGSGNKGKDAAALIQALPPTTVVLFSEEKADKTSSLYKAVSKAGGMVECRHLTPERLQSWVLKKITSQGLQIQRSAMDYFLANTSDDLFQISRELDKVLSYVMGRDAILLTDVQAVIMPALENRIFDLIDAVVERKPARALKLTRDLLALKETPSRIIARVSSQFQILAQVKELRDQGFDTDSIAKKLSLKPYPAKKSVGQASRLTMQEIVNAVKKCVRAEEDFKTGLLDDVTALELLLADVLPGKG